ncbi:arsenate reductase ArsC [Oceanospirillum linum]|uniref:Low molecular weight phosphatase family protein n=1 Tax=Oceanospirillum linum TaxID=966 RepID=A0A1T1H864_OCELI|nr:arsenate reductase ArsC [Oceanospirillum linum]OOV85985.1 low molecular weight phosphatase family protein [Oceanospirillum linum]SEG44455.1 protein tyrosine phosphatase [Oleiphilus messinensis]SMP34357.1 protein tyrosine phosphatase [Oceanospirillum linum]
MNILYICTHNRCRSILSEAITNQIAGGRITAKSAGSQPSGEVHPLSIQYLKEAGISVSGLQSQSWDDLEAFKPDLVVTVCDSAAREACPVWFGDAVKVHWGLADPSRVEGRDEEKATAFRACIAEITARVNKLLLLADKGLTGEALKAGLIDLGAE